MYDYAKVYQSVCGYDFVLLDRTRCDAYVKSMREFADAELSQRLGSKHWSFPVTLHQTLHAPNAPCNNLVK